MASPGKTRPSPEPQPEDCQIDTTHAGADQDTSMHRWIAGLPPEIWLCVLDHLCPHCHAGPVLKPGVVVEESYDTDTTPGTLPFGSRRDLMSMSMTCKGFRYLAQSFVFHCFDSLKLGTFFLFRRTVKDRPDLARGVREMAVDSSSLHRDILTYLSNIRTLNFRVSNVHIWPHRKDVSATQRFVGDLGNLRHLVLMPTCSSRMVNLAMARCWLGSMMSAAPRLRSLRCHQLTVSPYSPHSRGLPPTPQNAFPNPAPLPANRITRIEFIEPWLGFQSLKHLLREFPDLQEFRFIRTQYANSQDINNRTWRSVDARAGKFLK